MKKIASGIAFGFILLFISTYVYSDEKITLSTYYPAPYGEYRTLAVGDTYVAPDPNNPAPPGTDLVVEGNAGIGTTLPRGLLHTVGAVTNSTTPTIRNTTASNAATAIGLDGALVLQDSDSLVNSGGMVAFGTNQGFFATIKGAIQNGNNNTVGDLLFNTRNAVTTTTLAERMRITSAGNVAIGTTDTLIGSVPPSPARLKVTGTTYLDGQLLVSSSYGSNAKVSLGQYLRTGGALELMLHENGYNMFGFDVLEDPGWGPLVGIEFRLISGMGQPITFGHIVNPSMAFVETMRINTDDADGRVGIGTSNPGEGFRGTRLGIHNSLANYPALIDISGQGDDYQYTGIELWDDQRIYDSSTHYYWGIYHRKGVLGGAHDFLITQYIPDGTGIGTYIEPIRLTSGNGFVGIGTGLLSINGIISNPNEGGQINLRDPGTTGHSQTAAWSIDNYNRTFRLMDEGVVRFTIDATGNVYINSLIPIGAGTGGPVYANATNGRLFRQSSDLRLKKNIDTISEKIDVLKGLKQLRGIYFNWNTDKGKSVGLDSKKEIGVIAQEVEKVIPEIVTTDNEGYKSVDYPKVVAFLIEVDKQQQKQIEELQKRIDLLEKNKYQ